MVPASITHQLRQLQVRECLLTLTWGLACCLAVALVLLMLGGLVDLWLDRTAATPRWVRWTMLALQGMVNLGAIYLLLLRPLSRLPSLERLANRVEAREPAYRHRLVTAIQLNRPGVQTTGVSTALLAELTDQAEALTLERQFTRYADHRRLYWAAWTVGPPLLLALSALVIWPELTTTLLARQFLADREIPRSILLIDQTPYRWPSGSEVILEYQVIDRTGTLRPELQGQVEVTPKDGIADRYPLAFTRLVPGTTDRAIYQVRVPPSTVDFTYRARLGDGRTRAPGQVVFEPRPAVVRLDAWVQLPDYVGRRPDGQRYERPQTQGEILAPPDASARVQIGTQKPIRAAQLQLLRREPGTGLETAFAPAMPMNLLSATQAEVSFELAPEMSAYRVVVEDEYGFRNAYPPRRGIALQEDRLPIVNLLPERFAGLADRGEESIVDGLPIPVGQPIRIGWSARSPMAVASARLAYRINEGPWRYLPLERTSAPPEAGPFDLERGQFVGNPSDAQVEFFPVPSAEPMLLPGDLEAGGHFAFQTREVLKSLPEGDIAKLAVGDRVEYQIEVFDKKSRLPGVRREPGRSEIRRKEIVAPEQLVEWIGRVLESESRLRRLKERQQGVFDQRD